MYTDNYSILRILTAKGMGTSKTFRLLKQIKDLGLNINELLSNIDKGLTVSIIDTNIVASIKDAKEAVDSYYDELSTNEIKILNRFEENYPQKLISKLEDKAPLLLFCKGNLDLLDKQSVGFCGSREVTEKGLDAVSSIISYLDDKAVYVSGYAKGVDLKVHSFSLENNLKTIIVLPEGILYFKVKAEIKDKINWNNTLVISEFLPTSKWSVGNAMQRNSTIIALSKAMILIEAKEKGGSYNAGLKAIELEVPLFTPSYNKGSDKLKAHKSLADKGAKAFGRNKQTKQPSLEPLIDLLKSSIEKFERVEQQRLFAN